MINVSEFPTVPISKMTGNVERMRILEMCLFVSYSSVPDVLLEYVETLNILPVVDMYLSTDVTKNHRPLLNTNTDLWTQIIA